LVRLDRDHGATGLRLAGTSIRWTDIRAGRFRRSGASDVSVVRRPQQGADARVDRMLPGADVDVDAAEIDRSSAF
jgi:hypothetical protein